MVVWPLKQLAKGRAVTSVAAHGAPHEQGRPSPTRQVSGCEYSWLPIGDAPGALGQAHEVGVVVFAQPLPSTSTPALVSRLLQRMVQLQNRPLRWGGLAVGC